MAEVSGSCQPASGTATEIENTQIQDGERQGVIPINTLNEHWFILSETTTDTTAIYMYRYI